LAAEDTSVACPSNRDAACGRFVQNGVDVVRGEIRIAELQTGRVRTHFHHVRVFNRTAKTADAFLGTGRKTSDGTREHAVDARAAEYKAHVPAVVENLANQEAGQADAIDTNEEPWRVRREIGCWLDVNAESFVSAHPLLHSLGQQ
jgi:hypothetical protein